MEIYLNTSDKVFRLPILPPSFQRSTNVNYNTESIIGLGDVATYGTNGLTSLSLESFFPYQQYSFCEYSPIPSIDESIGYINNAKNKGIPLRLIIKCKGHSINQLMKIHSFSYGEQDGTGDVYYTIELVEHREIVIPTYTSISSSSSENTQRTDTNKSASSNQKTHKVVKGDSLWSIANKYYGKGSDYPKIKNANSTKYPSLKKNNIIYTTMELIIP